MKFRKKPVEVEAIKALDALNWLENSSRKLPTWLKESLEGGAVRFLDDMVIVKTLEGTMATDIHESWIIKGVMGEIYFCREDIFEQTYEPV